MSGLRARQKEERQRRILEAARQQFLKADYRDVTIEAIADTAGVSAMTVFNYYGSKGGLLLSLVSESDRQLIRKIGTVLSIEYDDAHTAVTTFSQTIFNHAFSYLDRLTWARVLATSILEGNSTFGRSFNVLEQELKNSLAQMLDQLKQRNLVDATCNTQTIATVLYHVHNARFTEYASNLDNTRDEINALVENDLKSIVERIS